MTESTIKPPTRADTHIIPVQLAQLAETVHTQFALVAIIICSSNLLTVTVRALYIATY